MATMCYLNNVDFACTKAGVTPISYTSPFIQDFMEII